MLTRDDGKRYVGTTDSKQWRIRMSQHRLSERFRGHTFDSEIIFEGLTPDAHALEEYFIDRLQTLSPHGLNLTYSGKGQHHGSPRFTTRGYRFSDVSREKMRQAKLGKAVRGSGWSHSDSTKKRWSDLRKGRRWGIMKIDEQAVKSLFEMTPPLTFPQRSSNGKPMTYRRAFCKHFADQFRCTPNGLAVVLKRVCPQQ